MLTVLGFALLSLGSSIRVRAASSYQLVQSSANSTFFDNWDFTNGTDINFGDVLYQSKDDAIRKGLVGVNSAGHAFIKLDNTTDGTGDKNFGRDSVYITSQFTISPGNLLLFDAVHLPFGCSVWPALWTLGTGGEANWPNAGEIDIIEGANLQPFNNVNLHTLEGCTHPDQASSTSFETGTVLSTDCFNQTNNNMGCIVQAPGNSFGESFSNSGGGVYTIEWTDTALSVWFFPRSSIPSDISSGSPDPSGWGTPAAFYPSSSCNFTKYFSPQTLIININICGNFGIGTFDATCSGNCLDLVQHPENYNNAFFEISYLKVFSNSSTLVGTATSSSGSSASPTTSSSISAHPIRSLTHTVSVLLFIVGFLALLGICAPF